MHTQCYETDLIVHSCHLEETIANIELNFPWLRYHFSEFLQTWFRRIFKGFAQTFYSRARNHTFNVHIWKYIDLFSSQMSKYIRMKDLLKDEAPDLKKKKQTPNFISPRVPGTGHGVDYSRQNSPCWLLISLFQVVLKAQPICQIDSCPNFPGTQTTKQLALLLAVSAGARTRMSTDTHEHRVSAGPCRPGRSSTWANVSESPKRHASVR